MIAGAVAGLALASGCSKKAGSEPATQAPSDGAMDVYAGEEAAEAPYEASDLHDLETQLLEYEDGLLQAGVDLPDEVKQARVDSGAQAGTPASDDGTDRCQRICELATNICGLSDQICALADEHADEPRYASSCERARQDCDRARGACEDCGE